MNFGVAIFTGRKSGGREFIYFYCFTLTVFVLISNPPGYLCHFSKKFINFGRIWAAMRRTDRFLRSVILNYVAHRTPVGRFNSLF